MFKKKKNVMYSFRLYINNQCNMHAIRMQTDYAVKNLILKHVRVLSVEKCDDSYINFTLVITLERIKT